MIINNKKTNTNIQVNIPTTAVNDNIDNNEDLQEIKSENIFLPYVRKNLMTKNEWYFYKQLKPVAGQSKALCPFASFFTVCAGKPGHTRTFWIKSGDSHGFYKTDG